MSPLRKKLPKLSGLKRAPSRSAARRGGALLGTAFAPGAPALGLPSLWPALDQTQMHFRRGELSLLAGRSAHGKSNFLLNLMLNWLEQDPEAEVYFCSLEMTPQQMAARLLSVLVAKSSSTSLSAVQALKFLAQEKAIAPIAEAIERLRILEERIHFSYEPLASVEQIVHDVGGRGGKLAAILLDPLSSVAVSPERARQNRRDLELSLVCARLKELAVRLKTPVIGAVPTRAMRQEEGEEMRALIAKGRGFQDMEMEDAIRARRPRLSHLPEESLVQEADMVLGLLSYLSDFQQEMEPDHRALFQNRHKGLLEISALKNRLGPLESAELEMDSKTSLIRDNPELKSI